MLIPWIDSAVEGKEQGSAVGIMMMMMMMLMLVVVVVVVVVMLMLMLTTVQSDYDRMYYTSNHHFQDSFSFLTAAFG